MYIYTYIYTYTYIYRCIHKFECIYIYIYYMPMSPPHSPSCRSGATWGVSSITRVTQTSLRTRCGQVAPSRAWRYLRRVTFRRARS